MTPAKLQPGIYRLTADVKNPAHDGRVTRDWRKSSEMFQARFAFKVEFIDYAAGSPSKLIQIRPAYLRLTATNLVTWSTETEPSALLLKRDKLHQLLWALLPHFERVDDVPAPKPTYDELVIALRKTTARLDRLIDDDVHTALDRITRDEAKAVLDRIPA